MWNRPLLPSLAIGLAALMLASCSERAPLTFTSVSTAPAATASSGGAASGPQVLSIKTLDVPPFYSPNTLTVHIGDTVTWTNTDPETPHTVTCPGHFDSGNLSPQQTWSHTFAAAGTYHYACTLHPWMTGTLVVQ